MEMSDCCHYFKKKLCNVVRYLGDDTNYAGGIWGEMKIFISLCLLLAVSACSAGSRYAEDVNWPTDPSERLVAEDYLKKADEDIPELPPGMAFVFRSLDNKLISDYFDYGLTRMTPNQIRDAYQENVLGNFISDLKTRACNDPDARFLLGNNFTYEVFVKISGGKKTKTVRNELDKGFCIAGERPFVDRQAIDGRFNMVRYWPNGEQIDYRLIEKLTGTFQLLAARFDTPNIPNSGFTVTDMKADGLMLSISLRQTLRKNAKLNKSWDQTAKGQSLDQICTSANHLAALTVGAVYAYAVDVSADENIADSSRYTVSYPDCLLYNRK